MHKERELIRQKQNLFMFYQEEIINSFYKLLMIVLEAIYSESGETSYKVAARNSSFIFPPGEARQRAFETVHNLYSKRNDILHGRKPKELTSGNLDLFEDYVRRSIVKLLDCTKANQKLSPRDFAKYFLLPWQPSP